jgi:hypothetical protein
VQAPLACHRLRIAGEHLGVVRIDSGPEYTQLQFDRSRFRSREADRADPEGWAASLRWPNHGSSALRRRWKSGLRSCGSFWRGLRNTVRPRARSDNRRKALWRRSLTRQQLSLRSDTINIHADGTLFSGLTLSTDVHNQDRIHCFARFLRRMAQPKPSRFQFSIRHVATLHPASDAGRLCDSFDSTL